MDGLQVVSAHLRLIFTPIQQSFVFIKMRNCSVKTTDRCSAHGRFSQCNSRPCSAYVCICVSCISFLHIISLILSLYYIRLPEKHVVQLMSRPLIFWDRRKEALGHMSTYCTALQTKKPTYICRRVGRRALCIIFIFLYVCLHINSHSSCLCI